MHMSPRISQECATVGRMLDIACMKSEKKGGVRGGVTVFDACEEVPIEMGDYLARWARHTKGDGASLIPAMVLLDRALAKAGFSLSNKRKHRLVLAALVVSRKYTIDAAHSNAMYSKIGGVTVQEISRLEREFLTLLDWECQVTGSEFREYAVALGAGEA